MHKKLFGILLLFSIPVFAAIKLHDPKSEIETPPDDSLPDGCSETRCVYDRSQPHAYSVATKAEIEKQEAADCGKLKEYLDDKNPKSPPGPVLVKFGAVWCPACRKMDALLASLQVDNPGRYELLTINVDHCDGLPKRFSFDTIPDLLRFSGDIRGHKADNLIDDFLPDKIRALYK